MTTLPQLCIAFTIAALTATGLSGCSSDDASQDAGVAHDSGQTTPSPSPQPSTDAGPILCDVALDDDCDRCLARQCCDAIVACREQDFCDEAFTSYRACVIATGDPSECFADFIEAARSDAGPGTTAGEALLACILGQCIGCGAPGTL